MNPNLIHYHYKDYQTYCEHIIEGIKDSKNYLTIILDTFQEKYPDLKFKDPKLIWFKIVNGKRLGFENIEAKIKLGIFPKVDMVLMFQYGTSKKYSNCRLWSEEIDGLLPTFQEYVRSVNLETLLD
jgi:hypothetical protein